MLYAISDLIAGIRSPSGFKPEGVRFDFSFYNQKNLF